MSDVRLRLARTAVASIAIAFGVLLGVLAFRVRTFRRRLESDLEDPLTDAPGD